MFTDTQCSIRRNLIKKKILIIQPDFTSGYPYIIYMTKLYPILKLCIILFKKVLVFFQFKMQILKINQAPGSVVGQPVDQNS